MSPDGSRVAIQEEKTVAIYDVPSGRLVGSAALDTEKHYLRAVFRGNDRLRIYRLGPTGAVKASEPPTPASIEVLDLDLARRKLVETRVHPGHPPSFPHRLQRPRRAPDCLGEGECRLALRRVDGQTPRAARRGRVGYGFESVPLRRTPDPDRIAGGTGRVHLFTRGGARGARVRRRAGRSRAPRSGAGRRPDHPWRSGLAGSLGNLRLLPARSEDGLAAPARMAPRADRLFDALAPSAARAGQRSHPALLAKRRIAATACRSPRSRAPRGPPSTSTAGRSSRRTSAASTPRSPPFPTSSATRRRRTRTSRS